MTCGAEYPTLKMLAVSLGIVLVLLVPTGLFVGWLGVKVADWVREIFP